MIMFIISKKKKIPFIYNYIYNLLILGPMSFFFYNTGWTVTLRWPFRWHHELAYDVNQPVR